MGIFKMRRVQESVCRIPFLQQSVCFAHQFFQSPGLVSCHPGAVLAHGGSSTKGVSQKHLQQWRVGLSTVARSKLILFPPGVVSEILWAGRPSPIQRILDNCNYTDLNLKVRLCNLRSLQCWDVLSTKGISFQSLATNLTIVFLPNLPKLPKALLPVDEVLAGSTWRCNPGGALFASGF